METFNNYTNWLRSSKMTPIRQLGTITTATGRLTAAWHAQFKLPWQLCLVELLAAIFYIKFNWCECKYPKIKNENQHFKVTGSVSFCIQFKGIKRPHCSSTFSSNQTVYEAALRSLTWWRQHQKSGFMCWLSRAASTILIDLERDFALMTDRLTSQRLSESHYLSRAQRLSEIKRP